MTDQPLEIWIAMDETGSWEIAKDEHDPVSYTHLDVYKRQVRSVARTRAPDRGVRLRKGAESDQEPRRRNRNARTPTDALASSPLP